MPVTLAEINAAKQAAVDMAKLYDDLDDDPNYDDIADSDLPDGEDLAWSVPQPLSSVGITLTYVSAYFRKEGNESKPKVYIKGCGATPYGSMIPKVTQKSLKVDEASSYLWHFMGTINTS